MRGMAVRCEKPVGVHRVAGEMHYGDRLVSAWRGDNGTEYMQIKGGSGEDWFRVVRLKRIA